MTGDPGPASFDNWPNRTFLVVRLAVDSGARRGELAALRFDDLDGRVLRIERSVSAEELTTPKSGRERCVTLGAATALLWARLEEEWRDREAPQALGPWLFSSDGLHRHRWSAGVLAHRFVGVRDRAGVDGASLHRLRHSVVTFLVSRGEILQAQARLGHRDAATTLREYAYALPLNDGHVADLIDDHLDLSNDVPASAEGRRSKQSPSHS